MHIYVVQKDDTLEYIAARFRLDPDAIAKKNELTNKDQLVVGQTIMIPMAGFYHFIEEGESLYKLSNVYNIPLFELFSLNELSSKDSLPLGYLVYIPRRGKNIIETSAYNDISIAKKDSAEIIQNIGDNLTNVPIFSYQVKRDGSLSELNDNPSIISALSMEVAPLLVLTNIEDNQFSQELATTILNDEALQDKLLDEALRIMKEKGYFGLDIDFEYLGAINKESYVTFLEKAKRKLKESNPNYSLSVALPPKTSKNQKGVLYEGHDYEAIGEVVDKVLLMTYEWGWSGGPPMAVSPLNKVKEVMEYALETIPKEKILMGVPLYGYDWTLPYEKGGKWAKAIDQTKAYELAYEYGANIEYDEVAQSPHFMYVDEEKNEHEVWFEDARSYQAKFEYINQIDIAGMYNWVLGFKSPQNWLVLQEYFIPIKLF